MKNSKDFNNNDSERSEDNTLEQVFILIKKGIQLVDLNRFIEGINYYKNAIKLMKNIGGFENEVEKVEKLLDEASNKQEQYLQKVEQESEVIEKVILTKEEQLAEFERKRKKEEAISAEAYNLLEKGSILVQSNQFDQALEKYMLAIEKFKEINWLTEIPKIHILIKELNEKKEVILRQWEAKMKEERMRQEIIEKEKEFLMQRQDFRKMSAEMKKHKFDIFQQQKKKEEKLSSEAYDLLGEASNLEEKNQFNEALEKYQHAIEKFKEINWDTEIPKINQLIKELKDKQKKYLEFFIKEKEKILQLKAQQEKSKEIEQIKEEFLQKTFIDKDKEKKLKELKKE